jgi:D-arabinonate dehydratase/D-galactarolactone cycloisomerase
MMKVDKVEVFPLYVPLSKSISAPVSLPHAEKIENIVFGGYRATVIRIYTDEGLVGIGECMTRLAPLALKAIIDEISPVIIGSDPMHPEAIWEILYSIMMNRGHNRGFFIEAISGIDIALWDIRAKALKQPMYMMFGGRQREKIWSYASSVRIREKSVVLDTVRSFLDKGFNAMKIKIGKDPFNYLQDLRLIEDIRAEVDDEVMLTADANCAYHEDVKLALRVGRTILPATSTCVRTLISLLQRVKAHLRAMILPPGSDNARLISSSQTHAEQVGSPRCAKLLR